MGERAKQTFESYIKTRKLFIMLLTSYHNHSDYSDGKASVQQMYMAAKQSGLHEFGLSDHSIKPDDPDCAFRSWGMSWSRLDEYVEECLKWKKELDDENFTIRLGLEVDHFSANWEENIKQLQNYPFDYIIAAVHFVGSFPIDHRAADWEGMNQHEVDTMWRRYFAKVRDIAATRVYDFLAHLDLPKKFNFHHSAALTDDIEETLQALSQNDLPIELNTAGWDKDCRSPYPDLPLLKRCCELKIPLLINADAHHPAHVQNHFAEARALAKEAGYTQLCRFEKRRRIMQPLL